MGGLGIIRIVGVALATYLFVQHLGMAAGLLAGAAVAMLFLG